MRLKRKISQEYWHSSLGARVFPLCHVPRAHSCNCALHFSPSHISSLALLFHSHHFIDLETKSSSWCSFSFIGVGAAWAWETRGLEKLLGILRGSLGEQRQADARTWAELTSEVGHTASFDLLKTDGWVPDVQLATWFCICQFIPGTVPCTGLKSELFPSV